MDVGAGFNGEFSTDYLTTSWRRILMFGRNYINGSVEWLSVPYLMRNDGPPWNLNIMAPYDDWGYRGSSTSPNLGGSSGRYSDIVSINWDRLALVPPIFHQRIFENMQRCRCYQRSSVDKLKGYNQENSS